MMKRLIVCLAVLVLASTAFGKGLLIVPPIAGDNQTAAFSISSDGQYIVGYSQDSVSGARQGLVYSVAGGSVPRYLASPPDNNAYLTGIAIDSTGTMYTGMSRYSGAYIGFFTKDVTLATKQEGNLLDSGGTGSNVTIAGSEADPVGIDRARGDDAWLCSRNDSKVSGKAYFYKWDGDYQINGTLIPSSGTGKVNMTSMSDTSPYTWSGNASVPLIVGGDRLGTGGGDRPMWSHVKPGTVGTSTTKAIPYLAGANTVKGQGYGISKDGMWMSGYMYKWSDVRLMGFRYNWTDNGTGGAAEELWPVGSDGSHDSLVTRQALAIDVTTDGTAVGYTYDSNYYYPGGGNISAQSYAAVIWEPGSSTGQLLETWLNNNGVNTSAWGWLVRAEGIEKRVGSATKYYITGYGYTLDGQLRAFYIAVPEPATMAFLALGGLALLRRR